MKNLRLLSFALFFGCFLPVLSYAQGVFIPPRTVFGTVSGITRPIAGATVTVCAANTAGIPCSPALANTVFKDQALTVPLANPFTTDANGNYPQAALPGGTYTITESAVGFSGFSAQVTVTCAPGAPCTVSTFTATSATIAGALTVGGGTSGAPTGNLLVGGGSPYFDVTAPPWNAACDGATDDATPFTNACNRANAVGGGTVFVPPGKTCAISQLLCDNTTGVTFTGGMVTSGYTVGQAGIGKPILKFTGSTSPLFGMRSTVSNKIIGLNIQYTNAAFTGEVVAAEHSGGNGDTNQLVIQDSSVTGTSTANGAACLVCMDKTIDSNLTRVTLEWAQNCVRGLSSNGSYSINNKFDLVDCGLGSPNGTVSQSAFRNMGTGTTITNPDIELGTTAMNGIDNTTDSFGPAFGFSLTGGFTGDCAAGYTGTMFTANVIGDIGAGMQFGCPVSAAGATAINIPTGSGGVNIHGDDFVNIGTAIKFAVTNNCVDCNILGNNYHGTIGTKISGVPASGIVQDGSGRTTIYNGTAPSVPLGLGTNLTFKWLGAAQLGICDGTGSGCDTSFLQTGGLGTVASGALSLFTSNVSRMSISGTGAGISMTIAPVATGTAAGLTGTGACATITTQTGGSWAGRATCTGATAASTLTITPGFTAPNGWVCYVQDQTTRANLLQQTSTTATACTLTATSITQNDVFVFSAIAF